MADTEAFNDFIANTSNDLFADDDENDYYDEEYYQSARNRDGVNVDNLLNKKNAKLGLFNLNTFWSKTDNYKYDAKNHLWDFMVFNNIREYSLNNYKSSVEMMNSELSLNILKCKQDLLNVSNINNYKEGVLNSYDNVANAVEVIYNNFVMELLKSYDIKLNLENVNLSNRDDSFIESMNSVERSEIESYISKNRSVKELCVNMKRYKRRKYQLIKKALYELLKSFNDFKNKILKEQFQDSKNSRINLTRFVKNLDKISNRFDFFAEYRFHNIKTYFKYKDELNQFITNYIAFHSFTNDFTDFVNPFNPNCLNTANVDNVDNNMDNNVDKDDMGVNVDMDNNNDNINNNNNNDNSNNIDVNYENTQEKEVNKMFNYMTGVETEEKVPSEELKEDNKDNLEHDDKGEESKEDLKLLEEARKRAAEILRMKRMQRQQSN